MSARVALVTGSSSGIGRACADRLAAAGWTVVGASRRGTSGEGWRGISVDVDVDREVLSGVADVLGREGRLDAVVAAAGWGLAGAVEDATTEEAHAQFETNFFGVDRVVRSSLPHLREHRGRVVIVGSIGGVIGLPFQAYYSATKFALEGYAEALAGEVRPFGIAVSVVQPGNFRTEFTDRRRHSAPAEGDPYGAARARALESMARDEAGGASPDAVAARVADLLAARRPPLRVSVGPASERVGVVAKRLLPYRAFERASRKSLGL